MAKVRTSKLEFARTGRPWKEVADTPKKKEKEFDMESASKKELEDFGREKGIELDRREKKSRLLEQLKNFLSL